MTADSLPQGQGHRTVLAQVVGDALGLSPAQITVALEHDSQRDPWSIAAGNYSSRFSGAVAGAAHLAAVRVRERLARIASQRLNCPVEEVHFENGRIFAAGNPENDLDFRRVASLPHWSPGSLPDGVPPALRKTARWTPPELTPPDDDDRVNSSAAYGFIFDFCGVEVDRLTGAVAIDRYVTTHDAGRRLNPALVDGQIHGAFAHAVGAALYEELAYSEDGELPLRHVRRLSGADRVRGARSAHPPPRLPKPGNAARRQGSGRRQLHDHPGLHRQCRGGRAGGGES